MRNEIQILGLSGKAGSGKSYIAKNHLHPLGFYSFPLAAQLKINVIARGDASFDDVFFTKPPQVRKLLQEEGTERGRNSPAGIDVWCHYVDAWIKFFNLQWGITKFLIDDCRFPNEVEYIRRNGGQVFRIVAPIRVATSSLSDEARLHPSETSLDEYADFDGYLYNDPTDTVNIATQLDDLLFGFKPINNN